MILQVFSVLDEKAQAFAVPFVLQTRGLATRSFADAAVDPNISISRHPSDYVLYQVGTFDDNSGRLESLDVPERICKASDLLEAITKPVARGPIPVPGGKFLDEEPKPEGN